ncbi:MAG TPA: hypothetical protein VG838_00220 [Opitutaceae bacterium]|nr:hypothetical protein [Opitutaceae bacterium]
MTAILFTAAAILAICLGFVFWLIRRSPEAHEDREGFHAGAPPVPEEKNPDSESRVA